MACGGAWCTSGGRDVLLAPVPVRCSPDPAPAQSGFGAAVSFFLKFFNFLNK
jgi:hypothetical protein